MLILRLLWWTQGRVYKIRSSSYIKSGGEYSFGRVDFEAGVVLRVKLRQDDLKQDYETMPLELLGSPAKEAWDQMEGHASSHLTNNLDDSEDKIRDIFYKNCVLYFPSNRFEEPSWLNEENLESQSQPNEINSFNGAHEPANDQLLTTPRITGLAIWRGVRQDCF